MLTFSDRLILAIATLACFLTSPVAIAKKRYPFCSYYFLPRDFEYTEIPKEYGFLKKLRLQQTLTKPHAGESWRDTLYHLAKETPYVSIRIYGGYRGRSTYKALNFEGYLSCHLGCKVYTPTQGPIHVDPDEIARIKVYAPEKPGKRYHPLNLRGAAKTKTLKGVVKDPIASASYETLGASKTQADAITKDYLDLWRSTYRAFKPLNPETILREVDASAFLSTLEIYRAELLKGVSSEKWASLVKRDSQFDRSAITFVTEALKRMESIINKGTISLYDWYALSADFAISVGAIHGEALQLDLLEEKNMLVKRLVFPVPQRLKFPTFRPVTLGKLSRLRTAKRQEVLGLLELGRTIIFDADQQGSAHSLFDHDVGHIETFESGILHPTIQLIAQHPILQSEDPQLAEPFIAEAILASMAKAHQKLQTFVSPQSTKTYKRSSKILKALWYFLDHEKGTRFNRDDWRQAFNDDYTFELFDRINRAADFFPDLNSTRRIGLPELKEHIQIFEDFVDHFVPTVGQIASRAAADIESARNELQQTSGAGLPAKTPGI